MKAFLVALAFLLPVAAYAQQEPRTVNLDAVLKNMDGDPWMDCRKVDPQTGRCLNDALVPLSLGHLVFAALNTSLDADRNSTIEDQLSRSKLLRRAYGGQIALTAQEVSLIEGRLSKLNLPAQEFGAAIDLLDPSLAAR